MKIVIVLPLTPWFRGGVENVVKEYCKELKEANLITIICTSTKIKNKIHKKKWMGIQVVICKSYIGILRISPVLVSYVRKHVYNYDILVIHNYSTLLPAQILTFKKEITVPIVFTPHFHSKGSSLPLQVYRLVYDGVFKKLFLKKIDAFQFVSRTERSEFIRKFPIKMPNTVIYNGINVSRFTHSNENLKSSNEKNILFVGRLEKYKNVEYVIKALTYLPKTFKLYVIGKGPYEIILKKLVIEHGLEKRVVFLGSVNDEQYVNWMKKTALFIQPSTIESFGLTAIEAVASGVKCIVNTNSYGLQELQKLFNNEIIGMKMDKGKERELATLIEEHITEEVKSEKIKLFDWKKQSIKLEKFYENVLTRN